MTNTYRLHKLNSKELDRISGGDLTNLIRKACCALGQCDENALIKVEEKACVYMGNNCIFSKYTGDDFFGDALRNASLIIHPQDRERMLAAIDKDHLLSVLEGKY